MTFVESNPGVADLLREAAGDLDVAKQVEILTMRAERAVTRLERKYDLVFADPPYEMGFPAQPLGTLRTRGLLSEDAIVVFEHSGHSSPETPGFEVTREERYGDVVVAFLKAQADS